MLFNKHSELHGKHAFLSASNYHWLNYNEQKLEARYYTVSAHKRGTDLHALAHEAIRLGVPLDISNDSLAAYVNDGIDYGMACEQPLFYSDNCFGTPDCISFKENFLRIHDLKTGITATSFKQLLIYAALFCLEYGTNPNEIDIELRIYQREEVIVETPEPGAILEVMDKIVYFDKLLDEIKEV